MDDVIRGYRLATGEAPMWPEWAFGFWQCRERYSSQQQLLDAASEFRRRGLPLDLIVQDWKYWGTNGWGSYKWDLKNYPDPATMMQQLHSENVKFMISVWCNPHGRTLADLKQNNALVGEWIDVFNPAGRNIRWQHLNDAFFKIGTDAWWGDATEPGDTGNALAGKKTFLDAGDFLQNAYPLFASQSIYEGQRAASPDKRVCILTRSAFPGLQRYASAIWSGDISGNWETFKRQIPAGLNFCLAGIPYWTTDCGGFWHPTGQYTSPDYNELLARWFEWSAFCPILRIHGGATATEMWNWLPETQRIMLAYDELRHRLLPYNYSVAWRVTSDGYTMMRALPLDFRADSSALAVSDEYMFGPAFLVAPVTEPQATNKNVYLPAGTSWVNFWSGENFNGGQTVAAAAPLEQMPLFVRAGSIVPLGPSVQFAREKPADPIELRVYRGANGTFTLYEDEGDNYNYERGHPRDHSVFVERKNAGAHHRQTRRKIPRNAGAAEIPHRIRVAKPRLRRRGHGESGCRGDLQGQRAGNSSAGLKSAKVGAAAPGQAGRGRALKNEIFDAKLLAILAFAALVAVLVHGVNVRLQPFDFRVGVQPAFASGNQRLLHELDRADDVTPLVLRQQRMAFALEQPDVRVVADDYIKVAVSANFLQKPHVAGVKPVVAAGDDDFFPSRCWRRRREFEKSFQLVRV